MTNETNSHPEPRPGLPPVEPPSARFLGQLFLGPGLIVAAGVALWLLFHWLTTGPRSPDAFLHKLDDLNPEVRWRAAADMSQVLLRDDRLAGDANFALALAQRLDKAQAEAAAAEESLAGKLTKLSPEETTREQAKLEKERNYVNYLAGCLGNFLVPAGAPILQKVATTDKGMEPKALAMRRRAALWALANLGENLKRFDKLPSLQQQAILATLGEVRTDSAQAAWAAAARRHLQARLADTKDAMGMDRTIEICAADESDPFLREQAAFACIFWAGDAAAEERIDQALARLAVDDGKGADQAEEWSPEDQATARPVTLKKGLEVQMNAAIAMARRGSDKVRLGMLQTMLDESELRQYFVLRAKNGKDRPNEGQVLSTMIAALEAIAELHRQNPTLAMPAVVAAVNKLAGHENPAVRIQAKKTHAELAK